MPIRRLQRHRSVLFEDIRVAVLVDGMKVLELVRHFDSSIRFRCGALWLVVQAQRFCMGCTLAISPDPRRLQRPNPGHLVRPWLMSTTPTERRRGFPATISPPPHLSGCRQHQPRTTQLVWYGDGVTTELCKVRSRSTAQESLVGKVQLPSLNQRFFTLHEVIDADHDGHHPEWHLQ